MPTSINIIECEELFLSQGDNLECNPIYKPNTPELLRVTSQCQNFLVTHKNLLFSQTGGQ